MARRALSAACACAAMVATLGCKAPGTPPIADLVSPGGLYTVRLKGRVTKATFFEHRVYAEVYKDGALYVPSRILYTAGFLDTAFSARFGQPEWIADNVLRFPPRDTTSSRKPDTLIVRNEGPAAVPSIRIETGREMFLAFDLPAGAQATWPAAAPIDADNATWLDVLVDSGNSDTLMRGHGTFDYSAEGEEALTIVVVVSSNGVQVTSTRTAPQP